MRSCSEFLMMHYSTMRGLLGLAPDDEMRSWLIEQAYTFARCKAKGIEL